MVYCGSKGLYKTTSFLVALSESVDSLCRNDADAQYIQYLIKQKSYNSATNSLKAYLITQHSSFRASMISNTNILSQKPCGRQVNTKVCGSKKAIFRILSSTKISREWLKYSLRLQHSTAVRIISQPRLSRAWRVWAARLLFAAHSSFYPLAGTPFFNFCTHAHT